MLGLEAREEAPRRNSFDSGGTFGSFCCRLGVLKNYFGPAKPRRGAKVELPLESVFTTRQYEQVFRPADFSNQWLEIWKITVFRVKLPHIPQILHGEAVAAWEFGLKVSG